MNESSDSFVLATSSLFAYVRDIIYSPATASIDIDSLPEVFVDLGKGLKYLHNAIIETKILAKELSSGNLNCLLPSSDNEIAAPLKSLHAALRHLTWQTQQVANGDYNQRVDFMGNFSVAFNYMISQLRQRRKININERSKLEAYVQLVLENCSNPLLVFDALGKLVFVSNSWFKYCSFFTEDSIRGRQIHEIFNSVVSEESLNEITYSYNAALADKQTRESVQDIDFGFHETFSHFNIQYTPMLDLEGNTDGMMVFLFDLTESEQAFRESERARELAEQSSIAKTSFLAKMSHEIRTPMNAVIGMAELALRENNPENVQEHIMTIKQAGLNLLSIINDILDFSKIESGKLEIINREYHFSSLITDVINIIKTRALESRLRFAVNVDCNIPGVLIGDVARIRQILLNLLGNAVKYTEKGNICLSVNQEIISNCVIKLIIEVADNGKGIKKEEMSRLFEEFVQFDKYSNKDIEGTGLGLAITHSLIKAMNGKISVSSEYGKGSTFTVSIPQTYKENARLAVITNPANKNVLIYERREILIQSINRTMENLGVNYKIVLSEAEFHNEISNNKYSLIFVASVLYERVKETYKTLKTNAEIVLIAEFGDVITDRNVSILTTPIFCLPVANFLNGVSDSFINNLNKNEAERLIAPEARILVVDDITTNLKVAKGLIQPYEIHVDLCKSGQDAIRAVETTRYDIVFMDHMMPGMDGIEATAKIRAMGDNDPYYKSLPIIALTANAVAGIKEILIKSGFDDFLSKPIDTVKLNSIIETWIPKHKLKFTTNEARSRDKILPVYDSIGAENNGINIKIEGINVDKGISTTGGIAENYIRFLSIFYKDGKLKLDEIRECLQKNNISLYVTHVHGLKSAAAIIGAEKFSADAKNLEIAGKRNDWDYINKHNHVFLSDLERLLERINDIVSKEKSIRRAEITDGEQLIKTLNNLNKAFADFDSMGMNKCVKTLREYTHVAGIGECIENIIHDHLIGQYDEAVLKIENLLRELKN